MPQRVLVAIDESEQSRRALDEAIDLFPDATLVLLNAFARGPADAAAGVGDDDGELDALRERRHEMLRSTMEGRTHDGAVETVVVFGNPDAALVEYAEENDVDHVVVGSHSGGSLSEILVGSVAEEVVQRAPASVTVAR